MENIQILQISIGIIFGGIIVYLYFNNNKGVNQATINIDFNIRRAPGSLESVQVTFDGVGGGGATGIGGGATGGATAGTSGGGGGY